MSVDLDKIEAMARAAQGAWALDLDESVTPAMILALVERVRACLKAIERRTYQYRTRSKDLMADGMIEIANICYDALTDKEPSIPPGHRIFGKQDSYDDKEPSHGR